MPWFKARDYGWGWVPVTLEGWVAVGLFVVAVTSTIIYFMYRVRTGLDGRRATFYGAIWIVVWIALLVAVAWMTGEPPRWRWGG